MANCYRCGRPLLPGHLQVRRKVQTGEYVRRRYTKPFVMAIQTHFGLRVVCRSCAQLIDRQQVRKVLLSQLQVLVALTILMILLLVRHWL